jgi:hypothetical protein
MFEIKLLNLFTNDSDENEFLSPKTSRLSLQALQKYEKSYRDISAKRIALIIY